MKRYVIGVAVILMLSLLTWMFFHFQGMPLGSGSTLVVVLAWTVIVFIIMALVSKASSARERIR